MPSLRAPIALASIAGLGALAAVALAGQTAPTDIQQPGTQPNEISGLESPDRCDNCHGGYDISVEPAHNWRGSMMAHAARDPLFWANLAVSEQDFDGAGDLCLRCHTPDGWLSGRSEPTTGETLLASDGEGVSCDTCHTVVNPDGSEWPGVQSAPFEANDGSEGFYGSGMMVMLDGNAKLGPYTDAWARHQFEPSSFHRSQEFCGTCHDVSNPAVGDLAHNFGAPLPLDPGAYSGVPGAPVEDKAAFNNPPYRYGVVERTWSEYMSSGFSGLAVSDFSSLPAELQDGAVLQAYQLATQVNASGDYDDGTPRSFTCQTCHLPPVAGKGANKTNAPTRPDIPLHDLTGGNTWTPLAIQWLDDQGRLVLGSGLSSGERAAMADGVDRARANLTMAASLSVSGDEVTVTNLTGHKLLSGYPEGRRMWLRVTWVDGAGATLRTDGEYGALSVTHEGQTIEVESILDLADAQLFIWEAHYGMTPEWAQQLIDLGQPSDLALMYDRETGDVEHTLAELAAGSEDVESFHFVLNNTVISDNRVPPYGFSYDTAQARSALPVPDTQYGDPGAGGTFTHQAVVQLSPPEGAVGASVELLYQPTSWEFVQFLTLANDGSDPFLGGVGDDLLEAWLATGMAAPEVMATASWGEGAGCASSESPEVSCADGVDNDCDGDVDCDDADCAADAACVCDGDGVCDPGEDCLSCPDECDGVTSGRRNLRYCCGDGALDGPEGDGSVCDGNP